MAGCHRTRFTLCCIGSASLIPDEMFADSFTDVGGRGVPPMIVVMVLQRSRLSDREAVQGSRSTRAGSTRPHTANLRIGTPAGVAVQVFHAQRASDRAAARAP
jgi:hypothetical protein